MPMLQAGQRARTSDGRERVTDFGLAWVDSSPGPQEMTTAVSPPADTWDSGLTQAGEDGART